MTKFTWYGICRSCLNNYNSNQLRQHRFVKKYNKKGRFVFFIDGYCDICKTQTRVFNRSQIHGMKNKNG